MVASGTALAASPPYGRPQNSFFGRGGAGLRRSFTKGLPWPDSKAIPAAAPQDKVTLRSDAQGRVRFRLAGRGAWLVKAVHMRRAEDPAEADWESFWASLTFELP